MKVYILVFLKKKSVENILVALNCDKHDGTLLEDLRTFMTDSISLDYCWSEKYCRQKLYRK